MFVILVTYKKPLDVIDQYIAEHSAHLERGYQKNYFVVSGRKNPRTGGVIISHLKDRSLLENFISEDPFAIQDIADYEIIEFTPGKRHPDFAKLIE
ncbi:MAG: YciI family protein [Gammaproteobacteria bacterium]|nr:YciI family protein [Gammaproteobacteria bacterium]